jgi:predicted nucleic acid-binding protein
MFLIDTNVISELRKRDRAEPRVLAWADQSNEADFRLSCITLLEVRYGALLIQRRDPIQGNLMLAWFARDIVGAFAGRILPIDESVAIACAALHVPDPKPDRDAYIAATALVHDLTVVTRNTRDFTGTGVKLFNPWEAA